MGLLDSALNYISPNKPLNKWNPNVLKVVQKLADFQNFFNSNKQFNPIPQVQTPQPAPSAQRNPVVNIPEPILKTLPQQPITFLQQAAERVPSVGQGIYDFARNMANQTINEIPAASADIGRVIVNPINNELVPKYNELKSNLGRMAYQIGAAASPERVNPQQLNIKQGVPEFLANYAGAALPYTLLSGMEFASPAPDIAAGGSKIGAAIAQDTAQAARVAKLAAQPTGFLAKTASDMLNAGKSALPFTSLYGVQAGREETTPLGWGGKVVTEIAKGEALAMALAGAFSVGKQGFSKLNQIGQQNPQLQKGGIDFNAPVGGKPVPQIDQNFMTIYDKASKNGLTSLTPDEMNILSSHRGEALRDLGMKAPPGFAAWHDNTFMTPTSDKSPEYIASKINEYIKSGDFYNPDRNYALIPSAAPQSAGFLGTENQPLREQITAQLNNGAKKWTDIYDKIKGNYDEKTVAKEITQMKNEGLITDTLLMKKGSTYATGEKIPAIQLSSTLTKSANEMQNVDVNALNEKYTGKALGLGTREQALQRGVFKDASTQPVNFLKQPAPPQPNMPGGMENPAAEALPQQPAIPSVEDLQKAVIDKKLTLDEANQLNPDFIKVNTYLNLDRLNISSDAKQELQSTIDAIKPQIEKTMGQPMTNQQIIDTADASSKTLTKVVGQAQTEDYTASLLNARRQLAQMAQTGKVTPEYLDTLMAVKSQSTDIARKLQSFTINADPSEVPQQNLIIDAVMKAGASADDVLKAAEGVDFNNPKEASAFYRQFVKPDLGDWIDLIRYNSMLSSPKTLSNIGFGNLANSTVVAPVTKSMAGLVDFLTPGEQQHFIGEGPAYIKGYWGSVGDAAHNFADVLSGNQAGGVADVNQIPLATEGTAGKVVSTLSFFSRLHNSIYTLFNTLAHGGEEASLNYRESQGGIVPDIQAQSEAGAAYSTYRQGLNPAGQGNVLNAVDTLASTFQKWKNSDNPAVAWPAKFTFPFLRIATNMTKQGIEYSPAGFATMPGASDMTLQATKALMGTAGFIGAALLANSGNATWSQPTGAKEKQDFLAAGRQPYSLKVGNTWVSYDKLPPAMGIPLALASAYVDAAKHTTFNQGLFDTLMATAAKSGKFMADQSYVKNIGDAIATLQGDPSRTVSLVSGYTQQLMPYRALLGWLARIIDPYQRQVNTNLNFVQKQFQSFLSQIPFASESLPARTDQNGNPLPAQHRVLNQISPFKVSDINQTGEEAYNAYEKQLAQTHDVNAAKKVVSQTQTPMTIGGKSIYIKQGKVATKTLTPKSKTTTTKSKSLFQPSKSTGLFAKPKTASGGLFK